MFTTNGLFKLGTLHSCDCWVTIRYLVKMFISVKMYKEVDGAD